MSKYESKWPDSDEPDPGQYVQSIAELSHELGLENTEMYFKTVDEQGNKETYEGSEQEGLEIMQSTDVDNVRVVYGDGDNQVVFEYDSGADLLGKPYRVKVEGSEQFRDQVESAIGHDLEKTTGQKLKETVTETARAYLGNSGDAPGGPDDGE